MTDFKKRQSLTTLAAGFLASCLPLQAWSESNGLYKTEATEFVAYDRTGELSNVKVVVSTFGIGSAVTTVTNHSKNVVTVTELSSGVVHHNNLQFDTNAAIGKAGLTLKPGQKRILVAQRVNAQIAFA